MRVFITLAAASQIALGAPALAQGQTESAAQIDYPGFEQLTAEVASLRAERLLRRADFFAGARSEGALLLDTRSAAAFAQGHIAGAVNLPFSDFTEEKLLEVIGSDRDRPIYIYCNNNFTDDVPPVRTKLVTLALNIPTFINLVGYGYANVWELGDTMSLGDVDWVSSEPANP